MDWIDELVQQSLDRGPYRPPYDGCNRCPRPWHGEPKGVCSGAFNLDVDAIQSQGILDWTQIDY